MQSHSKYARVERERRFLLGKFPSTASMTRTRRVTDRYIDGTGLRLREQSDDNGPTVFKLTQKVPLRASGAQQGFVTSMYLTKDEFSVLSQLPAKSLSKTRYSVPEIQERRLMEDTARRILILGGGFAGVAVAMELEKRVAHERVEIRLVNRDNFFLFTPMLHEVAASDLDLTTIVNPVRKLLRRVQFFAGEVEHIDVAQKKVVVSHGFDHHQHAFEFDYLVIGLGSVTNLYGISGLKEYALTMKTLSDAVHLRNHLIAHLEEADSECCKEKRPLLTFVVTGGGFAGVETVAGINDFVRGALRSYANLSEDMLRVVLVHSGPVILPELGERLGAYARLKLSGRKVEIRVNTRVEEVSGRTVRLNDGTTIATNTLVWTAGTSPNRLLETIPCAKERGRLLVTEFLELDAWPGVWALGDCAAVPDPRTGTFHPPTAQHGLRQARVVAHNIVAAIRGAQKRPFNYSTFAQLAAIGRRTGVASIMGVNFSGFAAWWLWRTVYLSKLPRMEKKLRVAFDWTLDLIFSKDLVQFQEIRAPIMSRSDDARHKESDVSRM